MIKAKVNEQGVKLKTEGSAEKLMEDITRLAHHVIGGIAQKNDVDVSELIDLHMSTLKASFQDVIKRRRD